LRCARQSSKQIKACWQQTDKRENYQTLKPQMKNLLIATLALVACTCHSAIFVFTQSYTKTTSGAATTTVQKLTGFLVFDNAEHLVQIDANAKPKTFQAVDFSSSNWKTYTPFGTKTLQYIVAIPIAGVDFGTVFATGTDFLQVVNGTAYDSARSMTLTGTGTWTVGLNSYAVQYKGSLVYDSKDTATVNQGDFAAAVTTLKTALTAKGYSETL
jgi:hypothetical protein